MAHQPWKMCKGANQSCLVIIRGKRACVVMHWGPTYPKSGHKIKSMGKTNLVSPSYPYQKGKGEKQKRGKSGAHTLKNRYLFQPTWFIMSRAALLRGTVWFGALQEYDVPCTCTHWQSLYSCKNGTNGTFGKEARVLRTQVYWVFWQRTKEGVLLK